MADNVRLLTDSAQLPLRTFKEELTTFSVADTAGVDTYGINLAYKMRKQSFLLLQKIKMQQIKDTIVKRALVYIPQDHPINTNCTIYFVLTGWKWGDAYVVNINKGGGHFHISDDGQPAIIINLSLISSLYGQTAEEELKVLNGILSHEIFHFLFANYKRVSPVYKSASSSSVANKLFDEIQNEGIAHYIDKKPLLLQEYGSNPKYREAERETIHKLNEAFHQLAGNDLNDSQKEQLLRSATTGKYWTKYGSISGMFMAYHIEKEKGEAALRRCIQQGAVSFLREYLSLKKETRDLPQLSDELKSLVNAASQIN